MIDRIARVLMAESWLDSEGEGEGEGFVDPRPWYGAAKLVLEALVEPTDGMVEAGSESLLENGCDIVIDNRETIECWQAMIAAALTEGG